MAWFFFTNESTKNSWNQLVNIASLPEAGLQQLHPGERQGVSSRWITVNQAFSGAGAKEDHMNLSLYHKFVWDIMNICHLATLHTCTSHFPSCTISQMIFLAASYDILGISKEINYLKEMTLTRATGYLMWNINQIWSFTGHCHYHWTKREKLERHCN